MLSERKRKLIHSLQQKKFRLKHRLFMLEGEKIIMDALHQAVSNEITLSEVFCTEGWLKRQNFNPADLGCTLHIVEKPDIDRLSTLVTPQEVIGLADIPQHEFKPGLPVSQLVIALDGIRDPGNLGTIVRTADWFGMRHILCSNDTVDVYNPKVVQATMGAILRVRVYYEDLENILQDAGNQGIQISGLSLTGKDIYSSGMGATGLLIAGNESTGIRPEIMRWVDSQVTIPPGVTGHSGSESLNVASAVAIACAELRRRELPARSIRSES